MTGIHAATSHGDSTHFRNLPTCFSASCLDLERSHLISCRQCSRHYMRKRKLQTYSNIKHRWFKKKTDLQRFGITTLDQTIEIPGAPHLEQNSHDFILALEICLRQWNYLNVVWCKARISIIQVTRASYQRAASWCMSLSSTTMNKLAS